MKSSLLLLAATALLSSAAWGAEPPPAAKPNVIFILCDDMGWGDVGVFYQNGRAAAGLPAERTPQLDAMAAAGARFTSQYSGAPVCAPSRASILAGLDQGHSNVRDNQFDKAIADNHTLGTVMKAAGYATAAIGKWGLQGMAAGGKAPNWPAHPERRGFDYYYGYMRHRDGHEHYPKEGVWYDTTIQKDPKQEDGTIFYGRGKQVWDGYNEVSDGLDKCYTTDLFTARAKKWIVDQRTSHPEQPFFMYLAFDTPHAVLELPTQAYPAGGGLRGGLQWLGTPHHMINTASGTVDSYTYPEYLSARYHGKPWPEVNRRYASSVRRIDDCVGDLLQLLRDLKIDQNTLVVFTSDNGPSIESYLPWKVSPQYFGGYGPFDGIKRDCWEGGMREPSIAWWPGHIAGGKVIDAPSGLWDWLPTFTAAAGLPAPARADGVSLLPELTGQGAEPARDFLYFEYMQKGRTPDFPEFEPNHRNRLRNQMQAIREGDLLGVRYDVKSADDPFEIYDVAHDPKEAHNLAGEQGYAAWQARFKTQVIQARQPEADAPRPYDRVPMAAVPESGTQPGLEWRTFTGDFPWVPDFGALTAKRSGTADQLSDAASQLHEDQGLEITALLRVPTDGEYHFYLTADSGAFLRVHAASVIDADFGYIPGTERTGQVRLKAGWHPVRLSYEHRGNAPVRLDLAWSGPGIAKSAIPSANWHTTPASGP